MTTHKTNLNNDYDPWKDLIAANTESILIKYKEAINHIQYCVNVNNIKLIQEVIHSLNTYHPMHEESWKGWPDKCLNQIKDINTND